MQRGSHLWRPRRWLRYNVHAVEVKPEDVLHKRLISPAVLDGRRELEVTVKQDEKRAAHRGAQGLGVFTVQRVGVEKGRFSCSSRRDRERDAHQTKDHREGGRM